MRFAKQHSKRANHVVAELWPIDGVTEGAPAK